MKLANQFPLFKDAWFSLPNHLTVTLLRNLAKTQTLDT
jgi:hypothetical protein